MEEKNSTYLTNSGDCELSEEQSDDLRKCFFKTLNEVLIVYSEVYKTKIEPKIEVIKMSKSEEIKIQVFDGQDYNIWKKRLLLYLKWKKCDDVAKREKLQNDNQEQWDEKNLRAMNYIYGSINNDQLEFVGDEDTAFGILIKFDHFYSKESTALQICIRNKLDKLKLKDYEDSSTFFTDFEKTINELKSAGGQVKEQEKLNYMLRTLPDSLSYIGDLIDAIKEEDRNCEFLKSKITMWEVKMKSDTNKNKASVFKVENKQDVICCGCNKPGHIIKYCKNQWRRGFGRSRPNGAGTYRQGGAHNQQISQQQPSRGRGGRGYTRRGYNNRGRGWQPRREDNTTEEHDARYSYNEQREYKGSFLTRIVSNENIKDNVEIYNCNVNKIDWILDSGCSDHIINDDSYFSESLNLKNPINVKVGDGRILKGTKVGKVCTHFIVHGKRIQITISNVFYVKDMDKNLISFAKVTDKNKIISIDQTAEIYDKNDNLIGIAFKENGLYKMSSFINEKKNYNTETDNNVCNVTF